MGRAGRTTWRHWIDTWLSGSPRGRAEERAAEEMLAASERELDRDREGAIRPLGPPRFRGRGSAAEADAAGLAEVLAG